MAWVEGISNAIHFIEDNITDELSIEEISSKAYVSPFYFQKGFAMLCGFTIGEYIRQRRLTLAGSEIVATDEKIIDIAIKYGYDSPDSFTKAFTRFHGVTPTAVRKDGAMIRSFAPIKIELTLKGGYIMDYRIVEKEAFTVMGMSHRVKYDKPMSTIPEIWGEHCRTGKCEYVCGMYGVCIDDDKEGISFEYLIADDYVPYKDIPADCTTRVIAKHTWAVFPCKGVMPDSLQSVNKKIFSEWLPNSKEYEIAAGYNIEMYTNPQDYPKGMNDPNYYSEIWIPVKNK